MVALLPIPAVVNMTGVYCTYPPLILLSALECSCDCCCMAMERPMMGPGGRKCLLSPVAIARIPSAMASSAACCRFRATCESQQNSAFEIAIIVSFKGITA